MIKLFLFFIFAIPLVVSASEIKIEPVYGVERTYHQSPSPGRYKSEVFVGLRATYGTEFIAGEFEINRSQNSYEQGDSKTDISSQRYLFGVRLIPIVDSWYSVYFRGGLRAQKIDRDIKVNGEKTNSDTPLSIDPYAGAGLSFNFNELISVNTSATLVFNKDATSSEQYDTRYTFSVSFKFGNSQSSFNSTY